jgi:invasion protein IalB
MTLHSRYVRLTLVVAIIAVAQPAVLAGQSARVGGPPLPVIAAPVEEMHGDWRVTCAPQDGKRVCVFSQQQTNKETGQLLLAIELRALLPDFAEGTLILPFGLALQNPISLEINSAPIGSPVLVGRACRWDVWLV